MFKLESYITPIILSHVEKYVKNVRAEQSQVRQQMELSYLCSYNLAQPNPNPLLMLLRAKVGVSRELFMYLCTVQTYCMSQVSLWGGDVSFSNLDLRLDVLERELRLPFSFISGHIHELQIHVPWTRLNAEPIVITINTIGNALCVLGTRST